MRKQAILILAHDRFDVLQKLLEALDSPFVDVFLHVDARSREFDEAAVEILAGHCRLSQFCLVKRWPIYWGGENMILASLALFKKARATADYSYFHLISGKDFLLEPVEKLVKHFDARYPANFIQARLVEQELPMTQLANFRPARPANRINFYYPKNVPNRQVFKLAAGALSVPQKLLHIKRFDCQEQLYAGSQWLSITEKAVDCLLRREAEIRVRIRRTYAIDELIFQTILYNTPEILPTISPDFRRWIDWERGHPYSFRLEDAAELLENRQQQFFVRKIEELELAEILLEKVRTHEK